MLKVFINDKDPIVFSGPHTAEVVEGSLIIKRGAGIKGAFAVGYWRFFTTEEETNAKA